MKHLTALIVSIPLLAPAVVLAQSGDSKYCNALGEKYDTYLETQGDKGGNPTPAGVVTAMAKCKTDPAAGIPVLEKALKAARLDLPPRG